ncbi:MAG: UDP-glucose 4-epimerase GalE [Flavobacteriales bacterium]|nr:UDP-glucose 4-epimerase GalE [Flavobacteriales bacterium]
MTKILVTGGLGYIGSHTVVELLQNGFDVVVVDNLNNSSIEFKERIERIAQKEFSFYEIDVCQTSELNVVFENEKIDGIIHFAAYKAVGESVELPIKYYQNNIGGLISLLDCMKKHDVRNIVFSSSCTVYGDTKNSPIKENEPIAEAISPYGTTKIIGEQILFDFAKVTPSKVVSLRYFNPVGAHQSALIGELPLGVPSNLVPYITQTAAGIRAKLTIFGNDYNTPDGTNIRDFIHVVDLAKAHVKAIDFASKNDFSVEVFNLGTGTGSSVTEVVNAFERVNNIKLNYEYGQRRAGDVEQIWADATKAKEKLGWQTELGLDEMMLTAWEWQKTLL